VTKTSPAFLLAGFAPKKDTIFATNQL